MDEYYIIAGLGNPGRKYDGSRHNAGFDVIDELVDRFRISGPIRFGRSMIGKGVIGGKKVILVKPLTYMNLSGEAVREIVSYYKIDPADHLIVISDDIDLPVGHLRIRKKGSAGGHNGLKNIILHLGDDEFTRIRIGVGGSSQGSGSASAGSRILTRTLQTTCWGTLPERKGPSWRRRAKRLRTQSSASSARDRTAL